MNENNILTNRQSFDTVDKKILIDKLKLYGITGNTPNWLYLIWTKDIKHVK